jgi:hypothetical protein
MTIKNPTFYLGTNAYDDPVYCIEIDGQAIFNPMKSSCGRYDVDPFEAYGLSQSDINALATLNEIYNFNTEI